MLPAKRPRSDTAILADNAGSRAALVSRLTETPRLWSKAADAAGTTGVHEFVCHLGRSVNDAARTLAEAAETSRGQLRDLRCVLHAAVDARLDELELLVSAAEAKKASALERELVAIDAALDRWQVDSVAVMEAVDALTDRDLEAHYATLSSRLDSMEEQLMALPTAVVEPPVILVSADTAPAMAALTGVGRVLAPLAILAADVSFEGPPDGSYVRSGDTLKLRMSLSARYAEHSAEELVISLGRLEEGAVIDATLGKTGMMTQTLAATYHVDVALRSLFVHLPIPATALFGDSVLVRIVSVAGLPVAGPPLNLPVYRGIQTPRRLNVLCMSPCISPEALFFLPSATSHFSGVHVFDTSGIPLPGLAYDSFGLSGASKWAAYAYGNAPTLQKQILVKIQFVFLFSKTCCCY